MAIYDIFMNSTFVYEQQFMKFTTVYEQFMKFTTIYEQFMKSTFVLGRHGSDP